MEWSSFVRLVRSDLRHHGGTTWRRRLLIGALDPSFRLLLNYRLGHLLSHRAGRRGKLLALWGAYLKYRQHTRYGCAVSYRARLGERVRFAHPFGIVIGHGVEVGDGVTIWQHVTLGSHGRPGEPEGYPVIEAAAKLYASAMVLGDVTVGRGATIGASAVVLGDVPAGKVAVGSPAVVRG